MFFNQQKHANRLFGALLGVIDPIKVIDVMLHLEENEVHIDLDIDKGTKFNCPLCDAPNMSIHDRIPKTWRHMDLFQFSTYIHFSVPRINCPSCGTHMIDVPWARQNSGFTLLFEYFVLTLAKEMPICDIAIMVGVYDTRIWRIVSHYVDELWTASTWEQTTKVGIDETSSKKGHNYISIFVDMEQGNVLFATPGKNEKTIESFANEMVNHDAKVDNITDLAMDMSAAFIKGASNYFPKASITFDKFHIIKNLNEAIDSIRRIESKINPILKGSRYLWLKNSSNLTPQQFKDLNTISKENTKTARAYRMKLTLQDIYNNIIDIESAKFTNKKWLGWASRSKIDQMKAFGQMIRNHFAGVVNYWYTFLTSGLVEGINSRIQEIKRRAKGYRNVSNFITMIYLVCGDLPLDNITIKLKSKQKRRGA